VKLKMLVSSSVAFLSMVPAMADIAVSLVPGVPSPQPVGTSIPLTAVVSGDPDPSPNYEYRFSVQPAAAPVQITRGYGRSSQWVWTPSSFEGTFTVGVTVKNVHAGTIAAATIPYVLASRLQPGANGEVNTTNHPLVALFTGPACLVPNTMLVRFTPASVPPGGISPPMATNPVPCRFDVRSSAPDATSMNFYVAGMYPNTLYQMHWETRDPNGALVHQGLDYPFRTGAITPGVYLPSFSASGISTSPQQPIVLHSVVAIPVNGQTLTSAATDLAGNVLWYTSLAPIQTEIGGNSWGFVLSGDDYVQGIREVDLAGNPVIETTVGATNEQLIARGARPITGFHHEVRRILDPSGSAPNNYILTIGSTEQLSTSAQGGTPGAPVDIIGDEIIVLDPNLNVVWTWDAFNYLDVNQPAVLGEHCLASIPGCEPFRLAAIANDWLHTNSAQYTVYDGDILISIRHQDVLLKLAFDRGNGDGHIVWKMGNGPIQGPGKMPLPSFVLFKFFTGGGHDLEYPWFSHQHDAEFELGGTTINGLRILTLYDDGNTRQATFDQNAHGRCQILAVDERTLAANLNTNADVGTYSLALGSAQLLESGNMACDSGIIGGLNAAQTNPLTRTTESLQNGTLIYQLSAAEDSYRTFRMRDLYTPPNP
jgi:hypothetical protein